MNKVEYLYALKEALKDTNQSVMEEIVSDYEEHFMVGIEKGKGEEQICEELGSIDDLVKEIKEVYKTELTQVNVEENSEANTEKHSDVTAEVKNNIESDRKIRSEIANNIICNNDNKSNETNGLNLIVDGICANVNVVKSSNGQINVNYQNDGNERQKQMYEFYSYQEGNTVYAGIRKVGKAVFYFNLRANSININVEIPENMKNINIKSASGDIQIEDVITEGFVVDAASGDVSVKRVYSSDCQIKSLSGDIELFDINSVRLQASTMSGDIGVKNLTANIIDNSSLSGDIDIVNMTAGECRLRNTSGDIKIKEFSMNNADICSTSGDVKLINIVGDGLRACSTSGDVSLEINVKRCHASTKSGDVGVKCYSDVVLESSSTSGDIKVHLKNSCNGYSVKSRTTTGELYIDYNGMHQRSLKTGTYTYGNQGSELILESFSGDIYIKD